MMKLNNEEKRALAAEFCERCATACDATCVAEGERDRMIQNLLRHGFRPL